MSRFTKSPLLAVVCAAALFTPSHQCYADSYVGVEQEVTFAGRGNQNEPLFKAEFTHDTSGGDISIKFTPTYSEQDIKSFSIYVRTKAKWYTKASTRNNLTKDPTSVFAILCSDDEQVASDGYPSKYPGYGFDATLWDYRNPVGDPEVTHARVKHISDIQATGSGEQYEVTIPASALKDAVLDLGTSEQTRDLLSSATSTKSGNHYYVYVTANISEDAREYTGTKGSSFARNYISGKLDAYKIGSSKYTTVKTAQDARRYILHERHLINKPYDGYSRFYRIPGISTAADGTIVVTSDARKYHNHDIPANIDVLARYSTDNGSTWSDHTILVGGTGMDTASDNCLNSSVNGYGDCAVARTGHGNGMVAAFIQGGGFGTQRASSISYCTSTDGGKSWSEMKEIPATKTSASAAAATHWCPGPGRMLLVENKESALYGKVILAAYNISSSSNNIMLLVYDPVADTWTSAYTGTVTGSGESQLVEIPGVKDAYLMSSRNDNSTRFWKIVKYNTRTKKFTLNSNNVSQTGNTFSFGAGPCNSNLFVYKTTESGKTYLVQAMPTEKKTFSDLTWLTTRSRLVMKSCEITADLATSRNPTLNWNEGIDFGDYPTGYSCVSEQADGYIGIATEEYPVTLRPLRVCGKGSNDPFLAIWYMSTSIENLTKGEVEQKKAERKVVPPVILPKTGQLFHTYKEGTTTTKDKLMVYTDGQEFNTENDADILFGAGDQLADGDQRQIEYTITINVGGKSTVTTFYGDKDVEPTFVIKELLKQYESSLDNGDYMIVQAQTLVYNNSGVEVARSLPTIERYTYADPTVPIKLVVMPAGVEGFAHHTFTSGYTSNRYTYGEAMNIKATIDRGVSIKFLGFSLNGNEYTESDFRDFNPGTIDDPSQMNLHVPATAELCSKYVAKDGYLYIYAWFEVVPGGVHLSAAASDAHAIYASTPEYVGTAKPVVSEPAKNFKPLEERASRTYVPNNDAPAVVTTPGQTVTLNLVPDYASMNYDVAVAVWYRVSDDGADKDKQHTIPFQIAKAWYLTKGVYTATNSFATYANEADATPENVSHWMGRDGKPVTTSLTFSAPDVRIDEGWDGTKNYILGNNNCYIVTYLVNGTIGNSENASKLLLSDLAAANRDAVILHNGIPVSDKETTTGTFAPADGPETLQKYFQATTTQPSTDNYVYRFFTPVNYSDATVTGIENVTLDAEGEAEAYYTLQGIRVLEPEVGQIYIVVRNGHATKEVWK